MSVGVVVLLLIGCDDEAKRTDDDTDSVDDAAQDDAAAESDESDLEMPPSPDSVGEDEDGATGVDAAAMASDASVTPPETAAGEAGSATPSDAGGDAGSAQVHTGRLWYTIDYCRLNSSGTYVADIATKRTTTQESEIDDVYPAPHGKWYVYRTRPSDTTSTYAEVDGQTWELIRRVTIDGRLSNLAPALHDSKLVAGFYYVSGKSTRLVVLDLTTGNVVHEVASKMFPADAPSSNHYVTLAWLPDGHFLLLYGNGERALGSLDGTLEALPSVTFPQGYTLGPQAWVSPDGSSYTVQLTRTEGSNRNSDVWIGSVRGDKFERFTRTNTSSFALWSPDGLSLVFDVDPQLNWVCSGGYTDQYHDSLNYIVPADARSVSTGTLIDKYTGTRKTGMKLLGWTL
jgi:hypothetical protein